MLANMSKGKKIVKEVKWRSTRTRLSPHQLLMGINRSSKKQNEAIKNMGLGSILQLRMDSLPSKLAHYVGDNFDGKIMVINLKEGNKEVNEMVVSGLLGIRNSGVVLSDQKKEEQVMNEDNDHTYQKKEEQVMNEDNGHTDQKKEEQVMNEDNDHMVNEDE
ncbi:hypothetical protein Hanom_Chr04g00321771 [Helianthus anomalus]